MIWSAQMRRLNITMFNIKYLIIKYSKLINLLWTILAFWNSDISINIIHLFFITFLPYRLLCLSCLTLMKLLEILLVAPREVIFACLFALHVFFHIAICMTTVLTIICTVMKYDVRIWYFSTWYHNKDLDDRWFLSNNAFDCEM